MVKLDEPHAALGQSPRLQAVGGECARFFHVVAVHLEHLLRFAGDVGDLRDGGLHAKRHFVLGDARLDLGVRVAGELQLVQFAEAVEHHASAFAVDAAWVLQVQHRVGPGAETHALVFRRQKAAPPKPRHERLAALALGDHDDKRREVVVGAAEAVVEPSADARTAGELRTGLHVRDARAVVDRLGMHRAHKAEVVRDA